jgi:ABC-type spermidine/putrescine transport system permease subunit II
MTGGRALGLACGWLAIVALLAPLGLAARVSFSPDSFLTPSSGAWSLRWYAAFLSDSRWAMALVRGLAVGVGAATVATAAGVPLAWAVARHRFAGRGLLAGLALVPAFVPPVVLAMGLLPLVFAVGLWGNPLGLVLAHGLVGLPVVFLVARSRLTELDPDLEAAARGLGATAWQAATRITLPLLRPAVLAGAAAAFAVSLNEAVLAVFLATASAETLPAIVLTQMRQGPTPVVAVASCIGIAAALLALVPVAVAVRMAGQSDSRAGRSAGESRSSR